MEPGTSRRKPSLPSGIDRTVGQDWESKGKYCEVVGCCQAKARQKVYKLVVYRRVEEGLH